MTLADMSSEHLAAISTVAAAIASIAALAVAALSYRMSKAAEAARRVQAAHDFDAAVTARLEALYPDMRRAFGTVDDGIPPRVRDVVVPFFVLYSDAWKAHKDGLITDRDWVGLGAEFRYWAQKPVGRAAWKALRDQTWAEGFKPHVDEVLTGPRAYPDLADDGASDPADMQEALRRLS